MNVENRFELNSKEHRYFAFCNHIFIFAFVAHLIYVPLFYYIGNNTVVIVDILSVFIDILVLKLNYQGFNKVAPTIWIVWIASFSLYCMYAFGWEQGYFYYPLALVIMLFFARFPLYFRIISVVLLCTAIIYMFEYTHTHQPITELDYRTQFLMLAFNALANFTAIAYASFYYQRYSEQIEAQLLHLANSDPLTGIYNRRFLEQSIKQQLDKSNFNNCALLLLDIDYFKNINDSYGHHVGDFVLISVTGIMKQSIRQGDIIGRIGGEEFAIFLIDVDDQEALQIAERVRKNIEMKTFVISDIEISLSISIGLTMVHSNDVNLSTMMVRSDQALYRAKNTGRNRIVHYESEQFV